MSRSAALLRERAQLMKQLARIDEQLADEVANESGPATEPTELERKMARKALDKTLRRIGR